MFIISLNNLRAMFVTVKFNIVSIKDPSLMTSYPLQTFFLCTNAL